MKSRFALPLYVLMISLLSGFALIGGCDPEQIECAKFATKWVQCEMGNNPVLEYAQCMQFPEPFKECVLSNCDPQGMNCPEYEECFFCCIFGELPDCTNWFPR